LFFLRSRRRQSCSRRRREDGSLYGLNHWQRAVDFYDASSSRVVTRACSGEGVDWFVCWVVLSVRVHVGAVRLVVVSAPPTGYGAIHVGASCHTWQSARAPAWGPRWSTQYSHQRPASDLFRGERVMQTKSKSRTTTSNGPRRGKPSQPIPARRRLPSKRPPTHPGEMLFEEFLRPLGISQS